MLPGSSTGRAIRRSALCQPVMNFIGIWVARGSRQHPQYVSPQLSVQAYLVTLRVVCEGFLKSFCNLLLLCFSGSCLLILAPNSLEAYGF